MQKNTAKKNTKRVAIVGATTAALLGGGVAFAYWTTGGGGTGEATMGRTQAVAVEQVGSTEGLVPGGDAQPVNFKINNPAPTAQYVSTVTFGISSVTGDNISSAHPCDDKDFTLVQPSDIKLDLPNGDTEFPASSAGAGGSIAMKDTASNQDGCKGAIVHLSFSAQ